VWLVTGNPDSEFAQQVDEVIVCTPEIERSWCHTASYTSAVAAIAALHGEDVSELPAAVERALQQSARPFEESRVFVVGAGRDWPTAQEATLKLREGAWVDATAYETEQILHGYFAAVDGSARAYVLEGEGRAAVRAADAATALETLGCTVDFIPTEHPVVDIVRFHLLTLAVAEARGIDPDPIRRTPGSPWAEAGGEAYPY
jgi:fructoselysine-6-P-deglycase FrlB-like protein